ncbi:Ig-like domain-containing protein [Embleya sp. NPDC001921]
MSNTTRESPRRSPLRRVRRVLPASALCVALSGAGACSGGDSKDDGGQGPGGATPAARAKDSGGDAPKTSEAVVAVTPQDGATGVATEGALEVTVTAGKPTEVVVKSSEGKAVEGTVAPDGAGWAPAAALQTGMRSATATGSATSDRLRDSNPEQALARQWSFPHRLAGVSRKGGAGCGVRRVISGRRRG